jgi:hypothetical protein
VLVGGRAFHFYVQPLSLSLQRFDPKGAPSGTEQWTLCGLVAVDRIRAASSAVSYNTLFWLGAVFIAVGASIPLLKLRMLRSHERLTRVDAGLVSASVFVEVSLVSFLVLDLLQFGAIVPRLVEEALAKVAGTIIEGFTREANDIRKQMDAYQVEMRGALPENSVAKPKIVVTKGDVACQPAWVCRAALRERKPEQIALMPYPLFDLVNWVDRAGDQRVKLASTAFVTPFINLKDQRVAWVERLSDALRLGSDAPQSGVSVLTSPTTGKRLTVFWKAHPKDPEAYRDAFAQLVGQSLATNPLSLDQPVLPADTAFAIVDRTGLVLFHSDRTRSMKENFIQESEDSLRLRMLVEHQRQGVLEVNYRARDQRLLVTPLRFGILAGHSDPAERLPSFESPDWSLIVFQEHSVPDTLNLYTLATAGYLFMGYASVLLLVCGVATLLARKRALVWLWPDRRQAPAYWTVAAINCGIALLCVIGIYGLTPPRALALTGAAVVAALGASVKVPDRSRPRPNRDKLDHGKRNLRYRWLLAFVAARSSLVVVLAVVPAMAAMHTAVTIEQRLFMTRDVQRRAAAEQARVQRLQARVPVRGLCLGAEGVPECDRKVEAYVGRLRSLDGGSMSIAPLFPDQEIVEPPATEEVTEAGTWRLPQMARLLSAAHPPVNDLGVGLAAVTSDVAPRKARPSFWWLLILPGVGLLAAGLVRDVTERLCLPALNAAPGRMPDETALTTVNRLVLTLPGDDTVRQWRHLNALHVDGRLHPLTWPANQSAAEVVVVHHLQAVLVDRGSRKRLLAQLEAAVYQQGQRVWLVCDREPVRYLDAVLPAEGAHIDRRAQADRNEVNRWIALLQSFRYEISTVGVTRLSLPAAHAQDPAALTAAADGAPEAAAVDVSRRPATESNDSGRSGVVEEAREPYYRSLWTSCSMEERLLLRQVAEEGLVNPHDRDVLLALMRKGLVVRDPAFRLMNEDFARFVKRAVPARTIAEWERQVAGTPWSSVRTAVVTFALAGAGFVAFTQQQIVSAWVGFLPALAPALVIPVARELVGKMLAQGFTSKAKNA